MLKTASVVRADGPNRFIVKAPSDFERQTEALVELDGERIATVTNGGEVATVEYGVSTPLTVPPLSRAGSGSLRPPKCDGQPSPTVMCVP